MSKRNTSDTEKQWLRQKFLNTKLKESIERAKKRMDIIPTSIALAQEQKKAVGEHHVLL